MAQTSQAFRLLDLPQEIQNQIYEVYFVDTKLVIEPWSCWPKILTTEIVFDNLPSLAIELTSKKVFADTRAIRAKLWSRLTIREYPGESLEFLGTSPKYKWLRDNIKAVEFDAEAMVDFIFDPINEPMTNWHTMLREFTKVCTIDVRATAEFRGGRDEVSLAVQDYLSFIDDSRLCDIAQRLRLTEMAKMLKEGSGEDSNVKCTFFARLHYPFEAGQWRKVKISKATVDVRCIGHTILEKHTIVPISGKTYCTVRRCTGSASTEDHAECVQLCYRSDV